MSTLVVLRDDRTGEMGPDFDVQEVKVSIFGVDFAGEMSAESRRDFAEAVGPFIEHMRYGKVKLPVELKELFATFDKEAPTPHTPTGEAVLHTQAERKALMDWCKLHNIERGKGRAPVKLWEAFRADDPDMWRQTLAADGIFAQSA